MKDRIQSIGLPLLVAVAFVTGWHFAVKFSGTDIFPTPLMVVAGLVELAQKGVLVKYIVASLFRVFAGFLLAVVIGIPLGLLLGWFTPLMRAFNPAIQVLRPISPIAWIPVAILWFGVGDLSAVFLIYLASFFPLTVAAMVAVRDVDAVHLRAGVNFGMSRAQLIFGVVVPSVVPQLIVAMRIALGIAWLVVVAAEMIAVSSGLGFLIVEARNAGNRYDLVVAGMLLIGIVGLALDLMMRRLERLDSVRWGYAEP